MPTEQQSEEFKNKAIRLMKLGNSTISVGKRIEHIEAKLNELRQRATAGYFCGYNNAEAKEKINTEYFKISGNLNSLSLESIRILKEIEPAVVTDEPPSDECIHNIFNFPLQEIEKFEYDLSQLEEKVNEYDDQVKRLLSQYNLSNSPTIFELYEQGNDRYPDPDQGNRNSPEPS